jgi:predicted Zn-dependent peptidase
MGLSHFYEHMIFKGTKQRSTHDIARALEKSGGSLNAFTGKEQVCLHTKFVDDELALACDLLKDLFNNPLFAETEISKEKNIIIEEIKASEDSPEEFVHDALMRCLWPKQPLGFPIAGNRASIKRLGRHQLLSFKNRINGTRVVISAAGNVRHQRLCALFSGIGRNGRPAARRKRIGRLPGKRRVYHKNILQANVAMGFRTCAFRSRDKYALLVLNTLLGDGMSSRLFQKIREKMGLAYSIYSFADAYADTGLMGVYFGTDANRVMKATENVLAEVKALVQGTISKEELRFAKSYIKGNILLGMENTTNRMSQLARSEIYLGQAEPIHKTLREIQKVRIDDLAAVGHKYFNDQNLSLAVVAPEDHVHESDIKQMSFDAL